MNRHRLPHFIHHPAAHLRKAQQHADHFHVIFRIVLDIQATAHPAVSLETVQEQSSRRRQLDFAEHVITHQCTELFQCYLLERPLGFLLAHQNSLTPQKAYLQINQPWSHLIEICALQYVIPITDLFFPQVKGDVFTSEFFLTDGPHELWVMPACHLGVAGYMLPKTQHVLW
ncbi:MAG: hypothetical protein H8E20_13680 [Verrucomicrobia bacterium]|nr:hypothetical protein [Verrucomicrobiota bacterium]